MAVLGGIDTCAVVGCSCSFRTFTVIESDVLCSNAASKIQAVQRGRSARNALLLQEQLRVEASAETVQAAMRHHDEQVVAAKQLQLEAAE